ncbi:hypothetical protein [Actinoplanes sp. HUAS TT8]|uniref:hypothetical protein n=1 Tax=Actinoplanes sp. HUAS TT8 TaxID=3447453 RepID=UPI003F521E3E
MTDPQPELSTRELKRRWTGQFGVAAGLLIGFAFLVVAMILLAGGDDVVWQRRVYVFGAVEALVFTAIGWLFGREVHRSAAQAARADADAANQAAEQARAETRTETSEAAAARVAAAEAATTLRAVRAAALAAPAPEPGGPRDVGLRPRGEVGFDLRGLITELTDPPIRPGSGERD